MGDLKKMLIFHQILMLFAKQSIAAKKFIQLDKIHV